MSLSILFLIAWSVAPASAEPVASPLSAAEYRPASAPTSRLPPDGATPLAGPTPSTPEPPRSRVPPGGVAPLVVRPTPVLVGEQRPEPIAPFGTGPPITRRPPLDPKTVRIVRLDLLVGPLWRIRRVDTMVSTSAEFGRMHGFSASFHTAMIVDAQREVVRALDVPIGFGAVARGRLRNRPLFASVGLSAGILVHRARTDRGVIHRVDPDFRLPIRLAWTIARVGLSLVIEQGYSVRNRQYQSRGVEVWARHAYRIGFAIGLHSDIMAGRATWRRIGHRRSRRV